MSSATVIAGYGEGAFYPDNLQNNVSPVLDAGWTRVILGLFHPNADGEIYFNDTIVFCGGTYVGDPDWITQLDGLVNPSSGQPGVQLVASFGGDPTQDFTNIMNIYNSTASGKKAHTFAGSELERNVNAMIATFNRIVQIVDMDAEDCYDTDSFVAFCALFTGAGLKLTCAPYDTYYMTWWVDALQKVDAAAPGSMINWHLQCYSGMDQGNAPQSWADAITKKLPTFPIEGFIIAGFEPSSTANVKTQLEQYVGDNCVGGAFVWTLDTIMNDQSGPSMTDYVDVVTTVLGG